MRIAINTLSVIPGRTGGGETYLTNLVRHLALVDQENQYLLLVSPANRGIFEVRQDNFTQVLCPIPFASRGIRLLWEQVAVPILVRQRGVDLLHSPANIAPLTMGAGSVVTIQALHWLVIPNQFPKAKSYLIAPLITLSARRATRVITVSHDTKADISKHAGISPERVCVVYEGVQQPQIQDGLVDYIKAAYDVPEKFILCVSSLLPFKNVDKLVEAFSVFKRKEGLGHKLVVVGTGRRQHLRRLKLLTERLSLRGEVLFYGAVPHRELWAIYSLASAFVYPSSLETFGLPPLEAMAQGCPVVASNLSSIPEIVGDAGLLVDPNDIEGLAQAISAAVKDRDLREALVARGFQRARQFSWEKAALGTLAVYQEAYRSARGSGKDPGALGTPGAKPPASSPSPL